MSYAPSHIVALFNKDRFKSRRIGVNQSPKSQNFMTGQI